MSLKAKLEAVIYAAEEPVTLAQMAALFADEALAWKAEQEAAAAEALLQGEENGGILEAAVPEEGSEAQTVTEDAPEETAAAEEPAAEEAKDPDEALGETPEIAGPEIADEEQPKENAEAAAEAAEAEPEESEEARAKRLARLQEREVKAILRGVLDKLIADYASDERGVEIREIAGGYRMATKPACHDAVSGFIKNLKPALKLSLPALETLAIIAYKQPVTAPEVNEIRGVESSGVFGSLLSRKLIATAGRKQVIGRPILYKTTKEFLMRFGLKDVSELPSMEEFEKMAASELDEAEPSAAAEAPGEPELVEETGEEQATEELETTPAAQSGEESATPTAAEAPPDEPAAAK